jgi:hypothetical protein
MTTSRIIYLSYAYVRGWRYITREQLFMESFKDGSEGFRVTDEVEEAMGQFLMLQIIMFCRKESLQGGNAVHC